MHAASLRPTLVTDHALTDWLVDWLDDWLTACGRGRGDGTSISSETEGVRNSVLQTRLSGAGLSPAARRAGDPLLALQEDVHNDHDTIDELRRLFDGN